MAMAMVRCPGELQQLENGENLVHLLLLQQLARILCGSAWCVRSCGLPDHLHQLQLHVRGTNLLIQQQKLAELKYEDALAAHETGSRGTAQSSGHGVD